MVVCERVEMIEEASGRCEVEVVHVPEYVFFFNDTATTEIYTLSLHDALPISKSVKTRFKVKKTL